MTVEKQNQRWNAKNTKQQKEIIEIYNAWNATTAFDNDLINRVIKVFENEYGAHNLTI